MRWCKASPRVTILRPRRRRVTQAAAVLIGLALTALFGCWWVDPLVGLGLAAVAIHEGREALQAGDSSFTVGARPSLQPVMG